MIKFSEILKRQSVSKVKAAEIMGIDQVNVNRTFERFARNLSEIDRFLHEINTSIQDELGSKDGAVQNCCGKTQDDGFLTIPSSILDLMQKQADTILSQQRTIEHYSGLSKKAKTA